MKAASSMNSRFIKNIIHKIRLVQVNPPLQSSAETIESNIGRRSDNRAKRIRKDPTFDEILPAFLTAKQAEGCSDHTISEYQITFRRLKAFLPPLIPLSEITSDDIRAFLSSAKNLRDASKELSQKSRVNMHIGLSSFWQFTCEEGYTTRNIIRQIHLKKPRPQTIMPLSKKEYCALLSNLEFGKPFVLGEKQKVHRYRPPFPIRNKAIIQLLLDTGLRASELCNLRWEDFNAEGCTVWGKGDKKRYLPVSKICRKTVEEYRRKERGNCSGADNTFVGPHGRPLDRTSLRQILVRISERAGVPKVFPHRFRHTFAINYLRNGGDIYTLQAILGHEDLDMCKRYLAIVRIDIVRTHKDASPCAGWASARISRELKNRRVRPSKMSNRENECSAAVTKPAPYK